MTTEISQQSTSLPKVSIIIPCRNERHTIVECLDSILASDYPRELLEILVADGMSDDGTRPLLEEYSREHPTVRVIDNPQKIVSPGLNRAILAASGEIIVRIDAHSEYARDYIRQCVEVMRETGADNVGGAWRTRAHGYLPQAIALAFHSPFAAGGARSRDVNFSGDVDTVIYGCWRREKLIELGMFDEELVRNQDDELNLRITRGGGRIRQSARILSWYQPRPSIGALARQYSQYGYWKVRVIQKHKLPASIRHLVPGAFVGSLLGLCLPALFFPPARWLFLGILSFYLFANLSATVLTCRKPSDFKFLPVLPLVFAAYHFGYGYGFLRGVIDFLLLRRGGGEAFKSLTRGEKPSIQ